MRHLDDQVLACFIEGNLDADELNAATAHLERCADCRDIVGEATNFRRDEKPNRSTAMWAWPVAAAVAAVLTIAFFTFREHSAPDGIHALVVAAPRENRSIEPRLTGGFQWAPLRQPVRGVVSTEPAFLKWAGAAGEVIEKYGRDNSPSSRHAVAMARLVTGDANETIAMLQRIEPKDATVWNDLAAANYILATTDDAPEHLKDALAASDSALEAAPGSKEALFNRALILEHLGLRDSARLAWQKFLESEPSGGWSDEARRHLQSLSGGAADFRRELDRHYDALAAGNENTAGELVAAFPQESRTWGEVEILARWARAESAVEGKRHFTVARVIGDQLRKLEGERMLADATTAIEGAAEERRQLLVRAYVDYRDARLKYNEKGALAADPLMRRAAQEFASAGSPMMLVAEYYVGQILHDEHRIAEADTLLSRVASRAKVYKALTAQILWERGLCHSAQGRWSEALRNLQESANAFDQLGEQNYAAFVKELLAEAYERVGDRAYAWRMRAQALRYLGSSPSRQLQSTLNAIAFDAGRNAEWRVANSFLSVEIDVARVTHNAQLNAFALLRRALVEDRIGEPQKARRLLMASSAAIAQVADSENRQSLETDRDIVAAVLSMATSPLQAVADLSRGIHYCRVKGDTTLVPDLLLQRGRAFVVAGDAKSAQRDFLEGIKELEDQRSALTAALRWGIFDTGAELFEEAIAVAETTGDVEGAFFLAERCRTRSRGESASKFSAAALPANVAIIEPVFDKETLIIFTATSDGIAASRKRVTREELSEEAARAVAALSGNQRDDASKSTRRLYGMIVKPVADRVRRRDIVVFVPPDIPEPIPFAALLDPATSRYLVEEHCVVVSPSAAMYVRQSRAERPSRDLNARVVVIAPGTMRNLDNLPAAVAEAKAIASLYPRGELVSGDEATRQRVLSECATASVVHFSGHAVASSARTGLVLSNRDGAVLDPDDIAALRLKATRLVVLAACQTAVGPRRGSEGPASIAYAFLDAGVPEVVATIWPVADRDAADFFTAFHRNLGRHASAAEALRDTQIEWIRLQRSRVWAAIEVFGS